MADAHWRYEPAEALGGHLGGRPPDPHAHELAMLAATVALQLASEGDQAISAGAGYTPAGVELLLHHQVSAGSVPRPGLGLGLGSGCKLG